MNTLALAVPDLSPIPPSGLAPAGLTVSGGKWPDWTPLLTALTPASRSAYLGQLQRWEAHCHGQRLTFARAWTRQEVTGYLSGLATAGKKPRTVQQALAAIKYGCRELHFAHYLSADQEAEVRQVKPGWGGKQRGAPAGRWLDEHQTREMLLAARRKAAGRTTALVGRRDCALLALMLGCGLRKGEAATVTVGQYQTRDGRRVLVDVRGKHGRVRIVPVPGWAAALLDDWLIVRTTAGITVTAESLLIVGIRVRWKEAKAATAQGLSGGQIWKIVWAYAREAGVEVCPHDLRRTFARLAREGGAAMDQIQMALGHEHSWTTELYVNARVDLKNAACDRVQMTL